MKEVYLQILRGRDGHDGLPGRDGQKGERGDKGEKGETGAAGGAGSKSGGVVYTRWGRKSCPNDTGAQLVYEGITGGSDPQHSGGGANYVWLRPMDYSPWSSKNLIDRNWIKKIMQVSVNATYMYTNFGGCGLFGFGDIGTFKNSQISPSTHGL